MGQLFQNGNVKMVKLCSGNVFADDNAIYFIAV